MKGFHHLVLTFRVVVLIGLTEKGFRFGFFNIEWDQCGIDSSTYACKPD
jgi:hypothetical protein